MSNDYANGEVNEIIRARFAVITVVHSEIQVKKFKSQTQNIGSKVPKFSQLTCSSLSDRFQKIYHFVICHFHNCVHFESISRKSIEV